MQDCSLEKSIEVDAEWRTRMNIILRASLWFFGSILATLLASLLYSTICKYPEYSRGHANEIHPFVETCRSFQQGSNLKSINETLTRSPEPLEQRLDVNLLVIRWESGECAVEFDPLTKRVTKIESQ